MSIQSGILLYMPGIFLRDNVIFFNMKIFILTFLIFCGISSSNACDVCGCGVNGYNFGILPNYRLHFIGLHYKLGLYNSIHVSDQSKGFDRFQTLELWGRYSLTERIQLYAILPYVYNFRDEHDSQTQVTGLGDISLLAHFIVVDNGDNECSQWKSFLQAGLGLKLPTGKNNLIEDRLTVGPNLQPGTGSTDFIGSVIYTLRHEKIGMTISGNYKYNTANKNNYRFGDQLDANARLFYLAPMGAIKIAPSCGINYSNLNQNSKNGKYVKDTGGSSLSLMPGLDIYAGSISIGANVLIPLQQNYNAGQTENKLRLNLSAHYFFQS